MNEVKKNGIYIDPSVAQFYDFGSVPRSDFSYCRSLASESNTVLDLGCGTGELAASLAKSASVTAVDPAAAMLEIARSRDGGEQVEYIQGDAKSLRLNRKFDLILLTGHTFQVFLTEADQLAVMATISAHLSKNGRFIFDSRNPDYKGEKQRDPNKNRRQIQHPEMGLVEAWNGSTYDEASQILSYENGYRVEASGESFSAKAMIKYTSQGDIDRLLGIAGLSADHWMGNWQGEPYKQTSPEIIPLGTVAAVS